MSLAVMTRVWAHPPCGGKELLVLLALADNADDDRRYAWPSVATLARKTNMSERSVQRALRVLEDDTIIRTVRAGGFGPNGEKRSTIYEIFPEASRMGDRLSPSPGKGDEADTPRVTPLSPEPSVEPSAPSELERTRAHEKKIKISGKPVNEEAWSLTEQVLASFNSLAGRKLRLLTSAGDPSEAAKRVYGRVRAYPDITLQEHADIIKRTLASKWWGDGEASIGVVFGPRVFEDNITRQPSDRSRPSGGGRVSASDLLRKLRGEDG